MNFYKLLIGVYSITGDIIYLDWNSDGHTEHVVIVKQVENGTKYTVENNVRNPRAESHYAVGLSDIYG